MGERSERVACSRPAGDWKLEELDRQRWRGVEEEREGEGERWREVEEERERDREKVGRGEWRKIEEERGEG